MSGGTLSLPANTGPVAGLAGMKVDSYLTPQYGSNIYGYTGYNNNANFVFAPNIPSGTHPYMADAANATGNGLYPGGGTQNDSYPGPNANLYTTWHNFNSFVYSGTINIPAVSDPNGDISFLKMIDDNEALYIDGHQVFNDGGWNNQLVTTLSQSNTSWLAAGQHRFYLVMYNGTGGAGPNSGWNLGFGWNLTGSYDPASGTMAAGAAVQQYLSSAANGNFIMPTDNGTGNVFTSQPVNSFSNSLTIGTESTLDVTTSGATNIFTGGLSIGDTTLHVVGGQTMPGSVQINGAASLTGVAQSTFDVQNSNTLTLYGVVSGNAGLHKIGAGTLVLGNYNTYTGGTTVNGGTLQLNMGGNPGTLQAGSNVNVNNGGTLFLNNTDALGYSTGAANLYVNGGGTVTSAGGFRTTLWNPVNMTGGFLTAAGAGPADGGGGTGFATNYSLVGPLNATSDAGGNPATIAAGTTIGLENTGNSANLNNHNNVIFNVARGPGAVDLNVAGVIGAGTTTPRC